MLIIKFSLYFEICLPDCKIRAAFSPVSSQIKVRHKKCGTTRLNRNSFIRLNDNKRFLIGVLYISPAVLDDTEKCVPNGDSHQWSVQSTQDCHWRMSVCALVWMRDIYS